MNKKILLIGGGGHAKVVLDSLLSQNQYLEIGIIDKKENIGKRILGIEIIGTDEDLTMLYSKGYNYAFVTVGSIGTPQLRIKLQKLIKEIGFIIPNIIDQTAMVSRDVFLEEGIYIGKGAIINAGTIIKKGAIINTRAIIEHDCVIGEFVHIAPGSVISGEVVIGDNTHIGANSVIKQQVIIGENTLIGIGSVVVKNLKNNIIAYGNPCREVREL